MLHKSQDVPVQVFNLHLVPIAELAHEERVLVLQASLRVLERNYPVHDAVVGHESVAEDAFDVIQDFPLMVQPLVQVKQLLSLQRLDDLRLLDGEGLLLLLLFLLLLSLLHRRC